MDRQLTYEESKLLFGTLGANGLFSLASGLAMTLGSRPIAAFLGVASAYWVLGLGIMLMVFGTTLILHFRRRRISRAEALVISIGDLGWVIASALLVLLAPGLLNRSGLMAVIAVAIIVLVFFELQTIALWRTSKHSGSTQVADA